MKVRCLKIISFDTFDVKSHEKESKMFVQSLNPDANPRREKQKSTDDKYFGVNPIKSLLSKLKKLIKGRPRYMR